MFYIDLPHVLPAVIKWIKTVCAIFSCLNSRLFPPRRKNHSSYHFLGLLSERALSCNYSTCAWAKNAVRFLVGKKDLHSL